MQGTRFEAELARGARLELALPAFKNHPVRKNLPARIDAQLEPRTVVEFQLPGGTLGLDHHSIE